MCYKYNLTFLNKTYIYKLKHRKTKTRNKAFFYFAELRAIEKSNKNIFI